MRIAVVQFPGSNCERETRLAVMRAGMEPIDFLWNEPEEKLTHADGFVIVGGFSWEDRLRAGAIAARHPVMQEIKRQSQLGKPVLGICNGAQILLESGIVLGPSLPVALTNNKRMKDGQVLGVDYYNDWVHIKKNLHASQNAFNRYSEQILRIPVAHAQGRFTANWDTIAVLEKRGQIAWQYCDAQGAIIDQFPVNPNGSVFNIAALTNAHGNVMAMMPHPERTALCDGIFLSMRDYIKEGLVPIPLDISDGTDANAIKSVMKPYQTGQGNFAFSVELLIADNHALTLQSLLNQQGLTATIKRREYWEVALENSAQMQKILTSGVLFNEKKSRIMSGTSRAASKQFLVVAKDDLVAQKKTEQLRRHFGMKDLKHITRGILWEITAPDQEVHKILSTGLLFNSIGSDCYEYT